MTVPVRDGAKSEMKWYSSVANSSLVSSSGTDAPQ